jgi:hypothetical protein
MDPRFWDELKRNTEKAVRDSGEPGVRLIGGVMDGWLVLPEAPALQKDWYKTNPPDSTAGPGRYVLNASGTAAEWVPESDAE